MTETVTRRRPGTTTDEYGDQVDDWTATADVDIEILGFAPGGSSEQEAGRTNVAADATLYLPPGVDVAARDRFVVRGVEWDASGDPADWRHPIAGPAGVVVTLRKVTG